MHDINTYSKNGSWQRIYNEILDIEGEKRTYGQSTKAHEWVQVDL